MRIFLDTANIDDILEFKDTGLVDGITTNPSLIASSGQNFFDVISKMADLNDGPISAEVIAQDTKTMILEGEKLAKIAKNIVVKIPLTMDGLRACHALSQKNIKTNVTLCFSANQALLAAKAGATYISPFVGRLDDLGQDGIQLIEDIRTIYDQDPNIETQILAASIRTNFHVAQSALAGADVATIPPKILRAMAGHPLTDKGLELFMADWQKTGQSIL